MRMSKSLLNIVKTECIVFGNRDLFAKVPPFNLTVHGIFEQVTKRICVLYIIYIYIVLYKTIYCLDLTGLITFHLQWDHNIMRNMS